MKRARQRKRRQQVQHADAMDRLLVIARGMLAQSTSRDAVGFDVEGWLREWMDAPQPALGGRAPRRMLVLPNGERAVARVLGAIGSGVYL